MYGLQINHSDPGEEFYEDMDSIFIYDYFEEGEKIILKFDIDYLKHNTAVAFPSIVFVRHNNSDIDYTLKSKHHKEEVKGKIVKI